MHTDREASAQSARIRLPARIALGTIAAAFAVVLIGAPLGGWTRVLRLPAALVPAFVLALCVVRPWRWPDLEVLARTWQPSRRLVWSGAAVVGLFLFWYVLTRFHSGQINAIDFTIYYDRPCHQTVEGRPLFVEVSDTPGFSYRSELADHAYWGMLAVCSLYRIHASPLWLHGISAVAIALGAVFVLRVLQLLGAGGVLAAAAALAFVLNDNTARALNYGFHPEVLYACFIPWMLYAALRGARVTFVLVTVAAVLVKEDAVFSLVAVSTALAVARFGALRWSDRFLYLALPPLLALGNLALFYGYVVPLLTGETRPTYAHFWGNYGDTPMRALGGMCSRPGRVVGSVASSGLMRVLQPHLFLPLIGWRWTLGLLPLILLYAASANDQLRAFGIYYAIVLVPLFAVGGAMGALWLMRRLVSREGRAQLAAASLVLLGAILVGVGNRGYSLRPWRAEIADVREAVARLRDEPVVLVQSGLFPHAGYDPRLKLLTPETLRDPRHRGAALLLAPTIGAYPFTREQLAALLPLPPVGPLPSTLVGVRIPEGPDPRIQR